VKPSCSASSSRPDRRRNRPARPLQRRRFQQHCSAPGLEAGRPRGGASRHGSHLVSSCARRATTVVPFSQRGHPMCHRCATPWPSSLPHQRNLLSFQR
jgi:hypothetical protein